MGEAIGGGWIPNCGAKFIHLPLVGPPPSRRALCTAMGAESVRCPFCASSRSAMATRLWCVFSCWRGCRQNLWHKAASSSRPEEDPSTCCCMTVTTRARISTLLSAAWGFGFCSFLLFFFVYLSLMLLLCSCVCRLVFVCTLRLVCWNFVCVCFFNVFLELVNTFYCLAVGILPLLLSSTYLFLFVTSSLSSKFLYPIHCRLFLSRK